jgi:hypothetical protein
VSAIGVLLVLLVLAYVGGLWARARHSRSFGSPSGVEYAVLGVLLGPHVLGLLGRGVQASFAPLAVVALGWIALGYGLDCGMVGRVRARLGPMVLGVALTAFVMGAVGATVFALTPGLSHEARLAGALAIGLVSAETTRYGVRRVGERHAVAGPFYRFLHELAAADDAPALLALPVLHAVLGSDGEATSPSPALLAACALGAALAMGALAGWLIARTSSPVERWTLLLGSTWLSAGAADLCGTSPLGVSFALGLGLSATSSEATVVRRAVARTEGTVLVPALVLAGALLAPLSLADVRLVGLAVAARLVANFVIGLLLSVPRIGTARASGPWLGLAMQSPGTLSMVIGFGIALTRPGEGGNSVLAAAIAGTLLGEIIGPPALRRVFAGLGELGRAEEVAS